MEFFCYHRDRSGSASLRQELLQEHWSYMDRYGTQIIAHGPTFASDGDSPTGSVHIVDLPDSAAARKFAFDEPNYQVGVYRDVLLRRWRNALGRTMWEFPGGRTGGNRYLVLGLSSGEVADSAGPSDQTSIAYGPLLSDDATAWLGTAALVRAADPDTAQRDPDPEPVRRHRSPQLAVRRPSVIREWRYMRSRWRSNTRAKASPLPARADVHHSPSSADCSTARSVRTRPSVTPGRCRPFPNCSDGYSAKG